MNDTDSADLESQILFADSGKSWDAFTLQNIQEVQELAYPRASGNEFEGGVKISGSVESPYKIL
jgi:hypothetical protein